MQSDLTLNISSSLAQRFPWDRAKLELEEKGWFSCEDILNLQESEGLLHSFKDKLENNEFNQAKVGKDLNRSLEQGIRLSHTSWIENWSRSIELQNLNQFFSSLSQEMNQYFYLNIKRWESQMAFYPNGGFYKKHLDQLKGGENRLMTCIFYLNDCVEGGELVIYDREDRNLKVATITPKSGTCVLFFSRQIFHEVLPSYSPRYSLTTWLRHDIDQFLS